MPARLRRAAPVDLSAALGRRADAVQAGEPPAPADLRTLTKHFLAVLGEKAPGRSVEVRVPPYAAAQVVPGVRHTRGTPPAVIETDAATWVALALGELSWREAEERGALVASGERADLSPYLPLVED